MNDPNPFESPQTTDLRSPDAKGDAGTPAWAWGYFVACLSILLSIGMFFLPQPEKKKPQQKKPQQKNQ